MDYITASDITRELEGLTSDRAIVILGGAILQLPPACQALTLDSLRASRAVEDLEATG